MRSSEVGKPKLPLDKPEGDVRFFTEVTQKLQTLQRHLTGGLMTVTELILLMRHAARRKHDRRS